jgi:hypothetical protein
VEVTLHIASKVLGELGCHHGSVQEACYLEGRERFWFIRLGLRAREMQIDLFSIGHMSDGG